MIFKKKKYWIFKTVVVIARVSFISRTKCRVSSAVFGAKKYLENRVRVSKDVIFGRLRGFFFCYSSRRVKNSFARIDPVPCTVVLSRSFCIRAIKRWKIRYERQGTKDGKDDFQHTHTYENNAQFFTGPWLRKRRAAVIMCIYVYSRLIIIACTNCTRARVKHNFPPL